MLFQYCSDLHLEFRENRKWLEKHRLEPKAEVLLLAGDIMPFRELSEHDDYLDYLSATYKVIYWVPGNHEYYHNDITKRSGSFCEKIRENIFLLNNKAILYKEIKIVFSTLWSSISPQRQEQIERSLNDFHLIRNCDRFLSVGDVNGMHAESLDFLQTELNIDNGVKKLVVTHHAPTFLHYPPKYKGSELNEAFATELYDFIEGSGASAWIYGHVHHNAPDFRVGDTLVTSNQLGYVHNREHTDFDRGKMIEI